MSTAPKSLVPYESVGEANKGENGVLKQGQEVSSTSDEGKAKKRELMSIVVTKDAPQSTETT